MTKYIVCNSKVNKPRMNVSVCLGRCPKRDKCPELIEYQENSEKVNLPSLRTDSLYIRPGEQPLPFN